MFKHRLSKNREKEMLKTNNSKHLLAMFRFTMLAQYLQHTENKQLNAK
jgi:hypothetical protein